jgi:hypothetical protein
MRIAFISSTISDLKNERHSIKEYLEKPIHPDSFKVLLSEAPDFPLEPEHTFKSVYEICVLNVHKANFFFLLLNKKYGIKNQLFDNRSVSLTHLEYLEAMKKHIPTFIFVHTSLWESYKKWKSTSSLQTNSEQKIMLLEFLNEIESSTQKKWLHRFSSTENLLNNIKQTLYSFDGSDIVADVTYPDGEKVTTKERFQKIWRIKNTGMQIWKDRILKEENPGNGLIPEQEIIPIPTTYPGQEIDLTIWFTAPKYTGNYISYWRMLDSTGRLCFPWKKGIWCKVSVVY